MLTKTTRHYEFTGETKQTTRGRILNRIRATRDLPHHGVKAGDLGGWIQTYDNLLEEGWVADEAQVCDYGYVGDRALLAEKAVLWDRASVFQNAKVYGRAEVIGFGSVLGDAEVFGDAKLYGGIVRGNARVFERSSISGGIVQDEAKVAGNAHVDGCAEIKGKAHLEYSRHVLSLPVFLGPYKRELTLTRQDSKAGHLVSLKWWKGTVDELSRLLEDEEGRVEEFDEGVEAALPELQALLPVLKARIASW